MVNAGLVMFRLSLAEFTMIAIVGRRADAWETRRPAAFVLSEPVAVIRGCATWLYDFDASSI